MELELLKTRFGEGSFNQCEIMLLDMANSRRLDAYIHSKEWMEEYMDVDTENVSLIYRSPIALYPHSIHVVIAIGAVITCDNHVPSLLAPIDANAI